jgi:hypothetical protein
MVIYHPPNDNTTTFINLIVICNTTGAAANSSIWVNQNGSVTGDQFALVKSQSVAANGSNQFVYSENSAIILVGSTASLLIKSGTASALNFTLFGYEVEEI